MRLKKGMRVRVIRGNHRGEEGKILRIFTKSNRVIVEGVNFMKRATRPSQENPSGGFVEREAPIHLSNVMLVHGGETTKIGYRRLEDGTKIRIARKTGEEIES
ncbi:MAG: 50S ribosomal protein L24 [FCB group bacterium]|nr:50S ribosomal protein L24 [FCB group bacterium]